jgi:hypothetical protein
MTDFENLSDDEVTERLVQRGVDPSLVASLVRYRDDPASAAQIERVLERSHWPDDATDGPRGR